MFCPLCNGTSMGRVGTNQYYCWECCLEFGFEKDNIKIYEIDDEGGLSTIGELEIPSKNTLLQF
ncbi:hypothetical protein H0A61_02404 [Koleobacter methoxysyntrophicus]|uniref:Uncharacterized protein n=2 Tax=Koleobacter methoxysyntrophicus TaxID=2751313 RepID=A0A8A0RQ26_9FIRM|nr:hypothetical protein [Thermosediminibacterales bacterium]QSQ10012.1 hypothetical protein H0A61_02404 [Koleobacter methoxysyntrophicus]